MSKAKLSPGDRVLLLYPPGLDFYVAFFASVYAGLIPVPVGLHSGLAATLVGLEQLTQAFQPVAVLTAKTFLRLAKKICSELRLKWFATNRRRVRNFEGVPPVRRAKGRDTAYIQCTSGSTSSPKGVTITQAQCLAHTQMFDFIGPGGVTVCWVPHFHDFGLAIHFLVTLALGGTVYCMSPQEFVLQPLNWIALMSKFKATQSGSPNFGLDRCVSALASLKSPPDWDLSHLFMLSSGGERVHPETFQAFSDALAPFGLRSETMTASYGLAEAVCMVTLSRDALVPARQHNILSCGPASVPRYGVDIRIVGEEGELAEGEQGEIWVASPANSEGYWQNTEASEVFHKALGGRKERYLATGDTGFVQAGQLYVCGRIKDTIVVCGRNVYAEDLELTVRTHLADQDLGHIFRPVLACVAVDDPHLRTEAVAVVLEVRKSFAKQKRVLAQLPSYANSTSETLASTHGLRPATVLFLSERSIPKTTSGKVQRGKLRLELPKLRPLLAFSTHPHIPGFRGGLLVPGTADYEAKRQQYATGSMPVARATPYLIAVPSDVGDIQAALAWATGHRRAVVVRSGGHQYSGLSSGGQDTVVMAMDQFQALERREDGTVRLGAAVTLARMVAKFKEWQVSLPHGECPVICVGGHFQTGGLGHFAQNFGLAVDHIEAFTIVLADGRVLAPTRQATGTEAELFWAVLGGSPGSFGVVTEFVVRPIPDAAFPESYGMNERLPLSSPVILQLLKEVQAWAARPVKANLDLQFNISTGPDQPTVFIEFATKSAPAADLEEVWQVLARVRAASSAPPVHTSAGPLPLSRLAASFLRPCPGGREFPFPFKKYFVCSTTCAVTDRFVTGLADLLTDVLTQPLDFVVQFGFGPGRPADSPIPSFVTTIGFNVFHEDSEAGLCRAEAVHWRIRQLSPEFHPGQPELRLQSFTFGHEEELDMTRPATRSLYFRPAVYERLLRLKEEVDPGDLFHTSFTIQLPTVSRRQTGSSSGAGAESLSRSLTGKATPSPADYEAAVVGTWTAVLRLEPGRVTNATDVTTLGADSLAMATFLARLEQLDGRRHQPADLLARPLIADYVQFLRSSAGSDQLTPSVPGSRAARLQYFLDQERGAGPQPAPTDRRLRVLLLPGMTFNRQSALSLFHKLGWGELELVSMDPPFLCAPVPEWLQADFYSAPYLSWGVSSEASARYQPITALTAEEQWRRSEDAVLAMLQSQAVHGLMGWSQGGWCALRVLARIHSQPEHARLRSLFAVHLISPRDREEVLTGKLDLPSLHIIGKGEPTTAGQKALAKCYVGPTVCKLTLGHVVPEWTHPGLTSAQDFFSARRHALTN